METDLITCDACGRTVHVDHWQGHRANHERKDGMASEADRRYARSTTVEHARDLDPRY